MSTFSRFPPRLQEAIVARLGWTKVGWHAHRREFCHDAIGGGDVCREIVAVPKIYFRLQNVLLKIREQQRMNGPAIDIVVSSDRCSSFPAWWKVTVLLFELQRSEPDLSKVIRTGCRAGCLTCLANRRYGDGEQDSDDDHHDQQFDQGEGSSLAG